MSATAAWTGEYQGERAVWLRAGSYEAALLPDIGGNLIAFRDTANGYRFLHEPAADEMDAFRARPIIHGIPVLFPPNRYEDGKFAWNGKVYRFPVNEPRTGNHLHGFLYQRPWEVRRHGTENGAGFVNIACKIDERDEVYAHFPHAFTIEIRYVLDGGGLTQHVCVRNEGKETMPCLLAFHTAINAPFAPGGAPDDCTMRLTIGRRWELNERMLPTGKYQELTEEEERMKSGGVSPFFAPMDNHYTAEPQNGRNFMELTDRRRKVKLVYDAGLAYKHWMVWNNGAKGGFFCPEPQINLVNAPNVALPAEQTGIVALEPGQTWEATSRLYCVEL